MSLIAIFSNINSANQAIEELHNHGISNDQIGVATLDRHSSEQMQQGGAENVSRDPAKIVQQTAADATSSTISGGLLGAVAGLVTGVAALTIPGLGGLLITGPLAASLGLSGLAANTVAGAAIGGAGGGLLGLTTSLTQKGVPEEHAKQAEDALRNGGVLLSISSNDEDIEHMFKNVGATQVFRIQ